MASFRVIIIFGVALSAIALSYASPTVVPENESSTVPDNDSPTAVQDPEFEECRQRAEAPSEALTVCIESEFTADKLNETRKMFSETKCVRCKQICRKQDEVNTCLRTAAESLKELSNRSRVMIPAMQQLVEEALASFCENEESMELVFGDEKNNECFRGRRHACRAHMNFLSDLEYVAFCDSKNENFEKSSISTVCLGILEFLECAERDAGSCSVDVKNGVANFISKIRNLETCAKYF